MSALFVFGLYSPFIILFLALLYMMFFAKNIKESLITIFSILFVKFAIFISILSQMAGIGFSLGDWEFTKVVKHPNWIRCPEIEFAEFLGISGIVLSSLAIFLCLIIFPPQHRILRWMLIILAIAALEISAYRFIEIQAVFQILDRSC
ncbi:hypothetical protein [Baaleninema simplex]|uniref:hypothetical protein n=1 Tax=Baaleninema simplex TaxID=2862350 RepID=UPI00036F88C2|nr:hypothetical protein [Baaleninema simplex]